MTAPIGGPRTVGPGTVGPRPGASDDARLRDTARQMEGAFVQELYKAMRTTVPQGEGVFDGGGGEETFTALMDQHLATETSPGWAHGRGLGEAIYQQLRRAQAEAPATAGATAPAPTPAPAPTTTPTLAPDDVTGRPPASAALSR
jgi:flagellar protein FlgJ